LPIRRGVTCQSIELLWRCRTLAQERQTLADTDRGSRHPTSRTIVSSATPGTATETNGGPGSSVMFTSAANDELLMGAEITFGTTLIGHVEGLLRDPVSQRVRRLITSYGLMRRRVGVPMEWVVKRSASRLVLGVGARSLDDLCDLAPA